MRKLNLYFFGSSEINSSDSILFYGTYTIVSVFILTLLIWSL
ncbi:hypothetical protein [Psychrobacillus phage Spoks]|nr:hypothetical protein [Psychrobacillus phage Spoks]